MRKTYAYNSIIFGLLFGIGVTVKAGIVLGIIVALVVSVVGFFIIRALENAISDGIQKGADAISNAMYDKKKKKMGHRGCRIYRISINNSNFPHPKAGKNL